MNGSAVKSRGRRGSAMVVILVALVVATTIMMITLRAFIARDRQSQIHFDTIQAAGMVDAAQALAETRIAADPDYRGESWEIDAQRLHRGSSATVSITAAEDETTPPRLEITVTLNTRTGQTITRREEFSSPRTREIAP